MVNNKNYNLVHNTLSYLSRGSWVYYFQCSLMSAFTRTWQLFGKWLDAFPNIGKAFQSFGMHPAVVIESDRDNMLFIPEGFTYGFSTREDAIFNYNCSIICPNKNGEGIIWNDPDIILTRSVDRPYLSEKDMALPTLNKFVQDSEGGL